MAVAGGSPGSGRQAGVADQPDLRIEAWAPTCEECVIAAVRELVGSFADPRADASTSTVDWAVPVRGGEELMVAVLEEVIYRHGAFAEVPVRVQVCRALFGGWLVRFTVVDAEAVRLIGATPKSVSPRGLRFSRQSTGWFCRVTIET